MADKGKFGDGASWIRGSIIGKGGFGSVYLATLKNPKSKFSFYPPLMAVKSAEVSASASIQKEREVLSNIKGCPYVIRCFGEETTMAANGAMVYNLLLEYGAGGTLSDRIRQSSAAGLPESEVKLFARSILRGLNHIHTVGYVHCDLKPDNILLVSDPRRKIDPKIQFRAKIGDFGLAKRVTNSKQSKKRKLEPYWRGTPMYLSPEVVLDNVQEPPADIWALGCLVLEMLTGKPPWERGGSTTVDDILWRIGAGRQLPEIPSGLSKPAIAFLKGCFVRNSKFRLTAEMLLVHPFLEGLPEDDFSADDLSEKAENLDEDQLILVLSETEDDSCDSFDLSEDEDSFSDENAEEDEDEEEEEEEEEEENVSGISEETECKARESSRARIDPPNEKASPKVPSRSRQHYPVNIIVRAGV
ncbi:mitogen-activated protein kinase kinase kinase 20-like [Andrographis paniculata]|uniref:mitogen-activated protein kinase kinase kinase 20-like n=1 Tax=Andrographis paniculata TaxID=175694 RepID=UPI0021E8C36B|nr:mitogen-activated protein kinase kinase kinase 20-like [Andrographis paniculata]